MSNTNKAVIGVIVLAVLAGAYYWYAQVRKDEALYHPEMETSTNKDTSDNTLLQGSAAIDAQMSALNEDNTQMNSSDEAVAQSY